MRQPGWYDAVIWLVFTALGFLVPVLVGIAFRGASGANITLEWIAGGGQFAVSAAGLLMTTYYFVARPGSISRLQFTEWFMLVSIVGLVSGVVLFALATLAQSGSEIDSRYYEVPSIVLFLLALATAFVAVGLDRTREVNEPRFLDRSIETERAKTEDDFDATF